MKMKKMLGLLLMMQLAGTGYAQKENLSWDELQGVFKCPEWFADARFGIWCHWGAQVQPVKGGGWYARHMYMQDVKGEDWGKDAYKYHCEHYGHPSEFGYKEVLNDWKAENLNPNELVKLFKKVGAKYFVILANHHDHFDNFNSTYHEWNSVNMGPHRDIVKEFEIAAKKQHLPFGVSSHDDRFMNWWKTAFGHDTEGPYKDIPYDGYHTKADGKGKWWEGYDPAKLYGLPPEQRTPEWEKSVKENWLDRHTELVTKYDVDMVWFDGYGFPYKEYGKELCRRYYNHRMKKDGKIDGVVVAKISDEPIVMKDVERGSANKLLDMPWQGILTPKTWFYKEESKYSLDVRVIIEMLADINSKNGNLLLNVELRRDGTICDHEKHMLDSLGNWMHINSEAIYGSRPWKIYGDNLNSIVKTLESKLNPTEIDLEALAKLKSKDEQYNQRTIDSPMYGHNEVRFTTNKGCLFMWVLNPAEGEISIPSLGNNTQYNQKQIKSIKMLGSHEKIGFDQQADALKLTVPGKRPTNYATIFKIKFQD